MSAEAQDSDKTILAALDSIVRMQKAARMTELDIIIDAALVFIRINYEQLPRSIAKRLTELEPGVMAEAAGAVGEKSTPEQRKILAGKLASDAAFAQAIRATNTYRAKLGYELLGPDGNPELKEV